jgi:hypothetical protein
MNDRRLLDGENDLDDFERELLEAGAGETPREAARLGALAAMGIGTPRGGGGGGVPSAGSLAAGLAGPRPTARLSTRWMAAGAIGLGLVVGVVVLSRAPTRVAVPLAVGEPLPHGPEREVARPPSTTPPAAAPSPLESSSPLAAAAVDSATAASSAAPSTSSTLASATTKPSPHRAPALASAEDPGIASEVAALEVARQAIGRGDTQGALRALDDYRHVFPHGMMQQEATLLRVEALAKGGDLAGARALADRFLAANPKSPHAERIRRLVGAE